MAVTTLALSTAVAALLAYAVDSFRHGRSTDRDVRPATVVLPLGGTGAGDRTPIMSLLPKPRPLPEIRFTDGHGRPLTLADFRDKMVLLNLWATWCGPCRREMPTLDRLQATLGGSEFEVLALSIDRSGIEAVDAFYAEIGIKHLTRYIDQSGRVAFRLAAAGLPTTLLIDREGREIARHMGAAEWDTPDFVAFFRRQLATRSAIPTALPEKGPPP